jgi:transposase
MTKATRKRYTFEFKQEAVRLVESGQRLAAAARSLGIVEQTLGNWVKAHRAGSLTGASNKPEVTAEQMEISRLRAELARVTMERDILHPNDEDLSLGTPAWEKRRHSSQRARSEVCLYSTSSTRLAHLGAVPRIAGQHLRLPSTPGPAARVGAASASERRSAVIAYGIRILRARSATGKWLVFLINSIRSFTGTSAIWLLYRLT